MEINFGTRVSEWDRSVKTYTLSPEELEKYREGKPVFTKEIYLKHKEEGKTDKEIMSLEKIDHNKLYALKRRWDLTGKKVESVPSEKKETEDKADWKAMVKDLKEQQESLTAAYKSKMEQINQLETTLAEKTKAFETIVSASEKLIEENKKLWKEIEDLNKQLEEQPQVPFDEDLERENYTLRQCLKMVL